MCLAAVQPKFLAAIQFTCSSIPIPVHIHVHVLRLQIHVRALLAARAAQHVATPTISQLFNFREESFRNQKSDHKIHKNIAP